MKFNNELMELNPKKIIRRKRRRKSKFVMNLMNPPDSIRTILSDTIVLQNNQLKGTDSCDFRDKKVSISFSISKIKNKRYHNFCVINRPNWRFEQLHLQFYY